jgi:RNA recognition motif-containing protein
MSRILEYVTREEAETALRHLDGRDIRGRPVRVQYAPERVCWLPCIGLDGS